MVGEDFFRILVKKGKAGQSIQLAPSGPNPYTARENKTQSRGEKKRNIKERWRKREGRRDGE